MFWLVRSVPLGLPWEFSQLPPWTVPLQGAAEAI